MEQYFCQSCGIPLTDAVKGTNADGSNNSDYCVYCYKGGRFTQDFTMRQMIEFCLQYLDQMNAQTGRALTPIQAKEYMLRYFPQLKRWRQPDGRTLVEKAVRLLSQCENVVLSSVDINGFPRPVPMSKIQARSFNEVWMTTSASSMKVADFRLNPKAGICYEHYGDSVALRGTVEIITDDAIRKEMWQDWFTHYFPDGLNDPNYVLLHFIGTDATFWINGEFSHSNIQIV